MASENTDQATEANERGEQASQPIDGNQSGATPDKPAQKKVAKARTQTNVKPSRFPGRAADALENVSAYAKLNKTEMVLKRLRQAKGATVEMLMEETGWQAHSVRGFLSAVVRKRLDLDLRSDVGKDGVRRYRINDTNKDA